MSLREHIVTENVKRLVLPPGFRLNVDSERRFLFPVHDHNGKQLGWRIQILFCYGFGVNGVPNVYQICVDQPFVEFWPLALLQQKVEEACDKLKRSTIELVESQRPAPEPQSAEQVNPQ